MKATKVRTSIAVVSISFAYACAGSIDGSGENDLQFTEGASPRAAWHDDDATADQEAAAGESDEELTYAEGGGSSEASDDDAPLGKLQQALGGSCGSKSSTVNSVFYYTTVPDHFPPDSAVAILAATAIGIPLSGTLACLPFGVADMHSTCDAHDACYATRGKSKSSCDNAARASWERACKRTYGSIGTTDVVLGFLTGGLTAPVSIAEQGCREACLGMAQAMYFAIAQAGQSAYDSAQRPTLDQLPKGPIFF